MVSVGSHVRIANRVLSDVLRGSEQGLEGRILGPAWNLWESLGHHDGFTAVLWGDPA